MSSYRSITSPGLGGHFFVGLLAALLLALLLPAPVSAAKAAKTVVCHQKGDGAFNAISIARRAVAAHRRHGDRLPGDLVPGMPGYVFGDDCDPVDITPPELTVPDNVTLEATGPDGATHTFTATATDVVDPAPEVQCEPSSGSTFPIGVTTVACTATDASGNVVSGSFTVTVVDPAVSSVAGRVTDIAGIPIPDVTLEFLSNGVDVNISGETDGAGEFSVNTEVETEYVINLTHPDYADQVLVVTSPTEDGVASFNVVMIMRGEPIIADPGANTQTGQDGAAVTFNTNDFVDGNGDPVVGDIQLTITPVDVSQPASVQAFPGLFAGIPDSETDPTLIVSLGAVEFEFTQDGNPLTLAPGATADVLLPIYVNNYPDGSAVLPGQTIPLWSLDESTGVWTQEGEGVVEASPESPSGLALRAEVTHFSWWNCDVATNTATAIVTVLGTEPGDAVITANAPGLGNWRGDTVATTIEIGGTTGPLIIPANREVCFIADLIFDTDGTGVTEEVCVNAASQATVEITLGASEAGPLDLVVRPSSGDDDAIVETVVGFPTPLTIRPLTQEGVVTYQLTSGALPTGLSLSMVGNRASIVGTPTEVGTSEFEITGTDEDGFTDVISVEYRVYDDDLDVGAALGTDGDGIFTTFSFDRDADNVTVNAFVGFEGFFTDSRSDRLLILRVLSMETEVNYQVIAGSFPPGLTVEQDCCIGGLPMFLIGGAPTAPGNFSATVRAIDDEGGIDDVVLNIIVSDQVPPPNIRSRFIFSRPGTSINDNLDSIMRNSGGPVDTWDVFDDIADLSDPDAQQCYDDNGASPEPLPAGITINSVTGDIMVDADASFFEWSTCIRATNETGSSTEFLTIFRQGEAS
jgi:hypothetical protein